MKLKDLPIGSKVLENMSQITFLVAAQEHPGYAGTTLVSDKIVAQACLDVAEPDADDSRIAAMGRSDYELSNLHQWLNAEGKDWYQPTHPTDLGPSHENVARWQNMYDSESYNPYLEKAGFLSVFGNVFRQAIHVSRVESYKVGGKKVAISARVFLPSVAELGIAAHENCIEGSMLPLFKDFRMRFAMPSEQCLAKSDFRPANFRLNDSYQYWLRSPHPRDVGLCCAVHASNPYTYYPAARPWNGVRPMLNIDSSLDAEPSHSDNFWLI